MNLELNCVRVLRHAQSKCFGLQWRRARGAVGATMRGRVAAASRDTGAGVMHDTIFRCGGLARDTAAPIGTVHRRGQRANGKVYRRTVRNGMTDT
ncbi:hypothetical protein [Burkholderia sp. USMB20]|uniref:hypothetical protein n=1 Tax=Burkholderia sp. USMB20 TaxID=1571773 RepID=UPI0005CDEC1E|nr:hypothetical protein [Burkholderia sp. USMB20]TGN93099.1 hypothetical protein PL79_031310 [Burkholderia sp. USMB20]